MKILRRKICVNYFILSVLTATFSTVFITDSSLFQGVVTAKYFYFAAVMCAVSIILPSRISRKYELNVIDVLLGAFTVYICINWYFLNGNPNIHWWLTLLMIPLYFAVRKATVDEKLRRWFLNITLVIVLIESLLGLLQLYGFVHSFHSHYKITGTFFNPGPYTGFLAIGIPLALGYSLDKTLLRWERWLGIAILFFALFVLPATMSRAAWIAVIVGCIPVLWKWFRLSDIKSHQDYIRITRKIDASFKFITRLLTPVVSRLVLVVAAGLLTIVLLSGIYMLKKDSVDGRMVIWSASMKAIKGHPFFGVGYGSFTKIYGDLQATYFLDAKRTEVQKMLADSPDYAFNEYVQIAVELGLVGLALFLFIVFFSLFSLCKSYCVVNSSLLTFLVFAAFSYPFSVLPLSIFFVFLLAISASSSNKLSFSLPIWLQIVGIGICWSITAFSAYKILPKHAAYKEWKSIQTIYNTNYSNEALKKYKTLYQELQHEKYFLFEYGQCLSKTGRHAESNSIFEEYLHYGSDPMVYNCMGNNYKEMADFDKAEIMYFQALQIVPNRHYPLYLLMKLYKDIGQTQKAKDMAVALLNKPVKVLSTAIREMREEARKIILTSDE